MGEDLIGGCLCGEVRYRITAAPVEAQYCHCRMCQRAHGAPVIAWLTVPLDAFAMTAGNPVAYRSSAKAFRHFCGNCGTPIYAAAIEDTTSYSLRVGSIKQRQHLIPRRQIWCRSALPWSMDLTQIEKLERQ